MKVSVNSLNPPLLKLQETKKYKVLIDVIPMYENMYIMLFD